MSPLHSAITVVSREQVMGFLFKNFFQHRNADKMLKSSINYDF